MILSLISTPSLIEGYSWQIITFSFCSLWIDSLRFPFPQHPSDWIYNLPRGGISILWCWILHYNAFQLNEYWNWCHANKKWVETKVSNVNVNLNPNLFIKILHQGKELNFFFQFPKSWNDNNCLPAPSPQSYRSSIWNLNQKYFSWLEKPCWLKERGIFVIFVLKLEKEQKESDIWHCYLRPDSDHFLT